MSFHWVAFPIFKRDGTKLMSLLPNKRKTIYILFKCVILGFSNLIRASQQKRFKKNRRHTLAVTMSILKNKFEYLIIISQLSLLVFTTNEFINKQDITL